MAKKRAVRKKAAPQTAKTKKAARKKQVEQYRHDDARRLNNPPVGLVTEKTDPVESPKKTYEYDPHLDPQLVWAGKAERTSFDVPAVSLHVHERIDPKTIIAATRTNGDRPHPTLSQRERASTPPSPLGEGPGVRVGRSGNSPSSRSRIKTRRCGMRSTSASIRTAGRTG